MVLFFLVIGPHLFENISSSGVEVHLLHKCQIHYLLKVVMALLRGILILWPIRESICFYTSFLSVSYIKSMTSSVTWLMQKIDAGFSFWTPWNWENTLCKDIGKGKWLPFVFASGAESTDIEKSGAARINEMFSIARRNGIMFFI